MTEHKNQSATDVEINVKDNAGECDYMHPEQCDKNLEKGKDANQIQKEIENELKKKSESKP